MLPQQKEAVGTIVISFLAAGIAIGLSAMLAPLVTESVFGALFVMILALWTLRLTVGVRRRALDERDWTIRCRAGMVGLMVFSAIIGPGVFALNVGHHASGLVPIREIAMLLFGAWLLVYLAWALVVLALYRKGA